MKEVRVHSAHARPGNNPGDKEQQNANRSV